MSNEQMGNVQTGEFYSLKDPGLSLIIVDVSIGLFLLLFAGMESAQVDVGKIEEKTINDVHQRELLVPTVIFCDIGQIALRTILVGLAGPKQGLDMMARASPRSCLI